jgi:RimJ/RimL family protein N-acetyltransferase
MFPQHRRLEIGWTWYDPAFWRTGLNRECKLLLLTYAFETLKAIRVQFLTDENNHRSRTAISGIGATMEGIMRNERIRSNGAYRNTVVFSIIDTEWEQAKALLTKPRS